MTAGASSLGQPASGAQAAALAKVLGAAFALAVTVGGMVGQGVLRAPGVVAGAVPQPALILLMWAAIGLLCLVDACAHVELAAAAPQAGGPYAFARRALGPTGGVVTGWADALNIVSAIGFVAVVSAEFIVRIGPTSGVQVSVLAPAVVLAFLAVNLLGTRIGAASQMAGSLVKGLALVVIIALLLAAQPAHYGPAAHLPPALSAAGLVVALRAIRNTYDGWNSATYFCEEMPNPGRDVPRTVFGGIVVVTALYVAINAALLHALTPAQMARSTLPAAEAIRGLLGDGAEQVTSIFAALSVLAITNLYLMFCSRIAFGMGRDGVLPRILGVASRDGAPRYALIAVAIPAAALAATGSYQTLLAISVPCTIVVNLLMNLAAIRLRQAEPGLHRPFRTPFYPWPIVLSTLINGLLLVAVGIEAPGPTLGFLAVFLAVAVIGVVQARANGADATRRSAR